MGKETKITNPEKLSSSGPKRLIKAFAVTRAESAWQLLELTLNEDLDVMEVVKSQPDMKAIITELFKVKVGKHWMEL